MTAVAKKLSDDQAVNILRNALVVAGSEMGAEGDHWPAIKGTIAQVMKDLENYKVERNVDAELKTQLYAQLEVLENGIEDCNLDVRREYAGKLKELREVYDAYFADYEATSVPAEEVPTHIKRAKAIIDTLEEENV